uniref:Uncharacterized protein n=1 Tax=Opuntia streptacantha TaxID=393608 RepID=A0A7C8Z7P0_OPUST
MIFNMLHEFLLLNVNHNVSQINHNFNKTKQSLLSNQIVNLYCLTLNPKSFHCSIKDSQFNNSFISNQNHNNSSKISQSKYIQCNGNLGFSPSQSNNFNQLRDEDDVGMVVVVSGR